MKASNLFRIFPIQYLVAHSILWASLINSIQSRENCIKLDPLKRTCSLCYNSTINDFGGCSSLPSSSNCSVPSPTNSNHCDRCKTGFYRAESTKTCHTSVLFSSTLRSCYKASSEIEGGNIACTECTYSFPSIDLNGCLSWSKASPDDAPFLENCLIGDRLTKTSLPHCSVCNDGYALDLTLKKCIKTTHKGCWRTKNSKCLSCRAWNGYFAAEFDAGTGSVVCKTKDKLNYKEVVTVPNSNCFDKKALVNASIREVLPKEMFEHSSIVNYADFMGGYVMVNWTAEEGYSTSMVGMVTLKEGESEPTDFDPETETASLKFDHGHRRKLPHYSEKVIYSSINRTSEFFKCFYFQKICMILNDMKEDVNGAVHHHQEVFLFNVFDSGQIGVVYVNREAENGNFITNLLPITRSNYLVLGFSSSSKWTQKNQTKTVLRVDFIDASRQFRYTIPSYEEELTCFRLLYVDYSNYFFASYSGKNGVLMYDLTQTKMPPFRVFHPEGADHEHLAYLEYSRVLLVSVPYADRLYGFSIQGLKLYQIETCSVVHGMHAFKASDYFVVIPSELTSLLYIYDLTGKIHHVQLETGIHLRSVVFSELFGNLFLLHDNVILRYLVTAETRSPSCSPKGFVFFSFSNIGCKNCSSQAAITDLTDRGVCELKNDVGLLIYQGGGIQVTFPSNTIGDDLGLKHKKSKIVKIVIVSVVVLIVSTITILIICCVWKRKGKKDSENIFSKTF